MTEQVMAEMIKAAYVNIMREYTQQAFFVGKQGEKDIQKAAKICLTHDFDPAYFVKAQDLYRNNRGVEGKDYFYSSCLCCPNAVSNYEKYLDRSNVDLPRSLQTQLTYLQQSIECTSRAVKSILMDDLIDFTPWFRILITKQEHPEIIAKYKRLANRGMTTRLRKFLLETAGLRENLGRLQ